jgi:hypothetical protein
MKVGPVFTFGWEAHIPLFGSLQMKVGLQLYKVDERHYLLDFKNLAQPDDDTNESHEAGFGSRTMGFFEICAALIRELAVSSG